ncbi:MAG TPA: error-prone DNA polymerase [Steroidobacteraceae bacterium]|nr:error-prone DNA polymerase [Steroidobacteraceae bacterium]
MNELPRYAELHCLTNFTFLRGASHPEELVHRARQLGYAALAITDECSVAGVVRAHVAAKEASAAAESPAATAPLKLLIGAEFQLTCGMRFIALATNRRGYGRLCSLITRGRRAASKGQYTLTRADVESCLDQCLMLWLPSLDLPSLQASLEAASWLQERFRGNLWIAAELARGGADRKRLATLAEVGRKLALPLVASGNVHMHVRERRRLQDVLTAIRLNVPLDEAGWNLSANGERYLRERARLARLYPRALLAETLAVAERCAFSLDELKYEYPREIVPQGETPATYLRKLVEQGARIRWPQGVPERARDIIEHELKLIAELSYEPYFLTVYDIVAHARSLGILCQGRGSAANSLVCYCLGVTAVGLERSALLIERFISKERNEPPDIDIDFEHERREEVIQYVYGKYGRERAAIAATVIMYRPRSCIRDLGKVFGLDPLQIRNLSRLLQWWDPGVTPERIRDAGFDPDSPLFRRILELARELIGFPRHLSQHVGGFVISAGPLDELVPTENAAMPDRTVVQWDKDDLNDLGLLKVDLLGLGMLSALRRALALVNHHRGTEWTLGHLPPEDRRVYEMMSRADTVGVFQIESRAQMAMLPRLRPKEFYDLVIEVAIVRPGPIQGDMVHPYLRRREGQEEVVYPRPEVQEVLARTLGVPIFQEQVMQLAIKAAGFTPGEADRLRRAMAAWKRHGDIHRYQEKLLRGMIDRGYAEEFALRLCKQIEGFGEYGFPECVVGETRVVDADTGRWLTIEEVISGRAHLTSTLACDDDLRLRKRKVLAVVPSGVKPVRRLRTALGHTIVATAEHPFMTLSGWSRLGELRLGDRIAAARECVPGAPIYWDEVLQIETLQARPTYDLQIEGNHNFLADNLIVHNSHACSFALLVYDSAWLKCHEPAAFTCALLNSQPMGFYAPAQLVRDAREHGVHVRPVLIDASEWECTLEPREERSGAEHPSSPQQPALRLGMRLVKSLSEAAAERIVAARRESSFTSVQDLARRAALDRGDLEALAAAGALGSLSGNRHLAFWEVAGTERPLALAPPAAGAPHADAGRPLLTAPTERASIAADYASVGLTLGRHPLALLRERLRAERIATAAELSELPDGRLVRIAGIVLLRQHPASAKGVIFMTLEDETGQVNLIVWQQVSERQRRPLLEAQLLEVRGKLQRQGLVMHVVAHRLIDRSELLAGLATSSRDFH